MTQYELDAAIARATGEEQDEIRRHGFNLVKPDEDDLEPPPDWRPPLIIDWDEYELWRNTSIVEQPVSSLRVVA